MTTVYDWISLALFAGIIAAFVDETRRHGAPGLTRLGQFLLPSVGCALVNFLGNQGRQLAALSMLGLVGLCILRMIRVRPRLTD